MIPKKCTSHKLKRPYIHRFYKKAFVSFSSSSLFSPLFFSFFSDLTAFFIYKYVCVLNFIYTQILQSLWVFRWQYAQPINDKIQKGATKSNKREKMRGCAIFAPFCAYGTRTAPSQYCHLKGSER
jgi:hypothetical protein